MSSTSIELLLPNLEKSNNDASVAKFTHPPPYIPGPYTRVLDARNTLLYLPTLAWFCLKKLAEVGVEQIGSLLDARLPYQPPVSEDAYDLLRALIPHLSRPEFEWASVDPRLWATIVQIYDNLPAPFYSYDIPLADKHLQLLQRVESTPLFSLVTILELPGCREVSDATIVHFKHLHTLCALDTSATSLSPHGLKILSGTVLWSDEDQTRKGPWGLRILRLRNCKGIDDKILPYLSQFLLLSILDLRGTRCQSTTFFPAFHPAPSSEHHLYHPTPLRDCVDHLSACGLFSSSNVFNLYINTLRHPPSAGRPVAKQTPTEDVVVTFNPGSSEFIVGSSSTKVPKALKRWRLVPPEDCCCPECVAGGSHRAAHCPRPRRLPDLYNRIAEEPSISGPRLMAPPLSEFARIAEQELSAQAAQQDIMSFYYSPNVPKPRTTSRGYAYPVEAAFPPSVKDTKLMLYRLPPSWAALKVTTPNTLIPKPAGVPEVVTGLSKRKRAEMKEFLGQLDINGKRQKIQEREAATGSAVCAPETMPLSRNPFRRKASKQGPSGETSSSAPKQLKAISSIAVPLLPASMTRDRNKDGAADPTLKRRTSTSSPEELKDTTHDRDKPKIQPKSAFDWNGWGKNRS
ncbi:hypothetical protein K438DRAFT_1708549 [Mycena galopus ATCC 62051]|nr:hypothetical protein K438DRAFT_1708549 [Mycena galopus ATCC 62051]